MGDESNLTEIEITLLPFISALEKRGVSYAIGGSVASSVFGAARSTQDIDLVSCLTEDEVNPLVSELQSIYYLES